MKSIVVAIALTCCCYCSQAQTQRTLSARTTDPNPSAIMFKLTVGDTTFNSDNQGKITFDINSTGFKKRAHQTINFDFHFFSDQHLYKVPEIIKAKPVDLDFISRQGLLKIARRSGS